MSNYPSAISLRSEVISAAALSLLCLLAFGTPVTAFSQEAALAALATDQTAADQSQSVKPEDLAMTRKIRAEIVKDHSLSQDAKNVEIETVNGSVTIKGQVKTSAEKWKLLAQADAVAGSAKVTDQIQVSGQ